MDQNAYNIALQAIKPVLEQKDFTPVKGQEKAFSNGKQAIQIAYNEASHVFELQSGNVEEDGALPEDWNVVSNWLFDNDSSEKDARSMGMDFAETLEKQLGVKKSPQSSSLSYALPKAAKNANNLERFTQRFLALFPQYKDEYTGMMERYGQFLPDTFYSQTAAPLLTELLQQQDKKALTKLFDLLNHFYTEGNAEVRSLINATILSELGQHREYQEQAKEYMSDFLKKTAVPMMRITEKAARRKKKDE